jgi:hypothetical protein
LRVIPVLRLEPSTPEDGGIGTGFDQLVPPFEVRTYQTLQSHFSSVVEFWL